MVSLYHRSILSLLLRDGATGGAWGQGPPKVTEPSPSWHLNFLKLLCTIGTSVTCLRVLLNFGPIRKVCSVNILLTPLAVSTLTIFVPPVSLAWRHLCFFVLFIANRRLLSEFSKCYTPVRKYRAMQSQNQAIIGPYFSFLAIIHHCKNVAIFLQGSCKNVRLVQGLILAIIRPCIRVTAAIFFGYQC